MSRSALLAFLLFSAAAFARPVGEEPGSPRAGEDFSLAEPSLPMVWIRPGTFFLSNPHGAGDDTRVTLTRGYWLGRTEVTQAQWQAVARHLPVYENIPLPSFFKGTERPVEQVSWDMAALFCAKLTELERAAGRLPAGYVYCLPTEAEWEYACRAGTTGKYAGELPEMAWYDANSGATTHPVALKKPNAWGLYDMHGNVAEWCADWYAGYPGGQAVDPVGPVTGSHRVLRGAAVSNSAGGCRSALRNFWKGSLSHNHLGFRLALAPIRLAASGTGPQSASP